MNQKGISVERERPIEREGGGEANVSLWWLCAYIMTTPGQISKKPIGPVRRLLEIYYPRLLRSARVIKRCFRPRRSVLRPFRRGAPRQRPANPMENRPKERKRSTGRREPFPVEIYAAGNSAIRQRYAIYLSRWHPPKSNDPSSAPLFRSPPSFRISSVTLWLSRVHAFLPCFRR